MLYIDSLYSAIRHLSYYYFFTRGKPLVAQKISKVFKDLVVHPTLAGRHQ